MTIFFVSTSESRKAPRAPGVAPDAAWIESTTRIIGDRPVRATSPHDADARPTATLIATVFSCLIGALISLTFDDPWSDENQQLAALIAQRLAAEQPAEQRY